MLLLFFSYNLINNEAFQVLIRKKNEEEKLAYEILFCDEHALDVVHSFYLISLIMIVFRAKLKSYCWRYVFIVQFGIVKRIKGANKIH